MTTGERPDLCAACGECCRTRPGAEEPARFLAAPDPVDALAGRLVSGDWVLARNLGVRYPRPATVAERGSGVVHAGAETSPCALLGPAGCHLPFASRPRGCRELEPWASGDCVAGWDVQDAVRAWEPLQPLVDAAEERARRGAGPKRPPHPGGASS